jgi:hypothetical protein
MKGYFCSARPVRVLTENETGNIPYSTSAVVGVCTCTRTVLVLVQSEYCTMCSVYCLAYLVHLNVIR